MASESARGDRLRRRVPTALRILASVLALYVAFAALIWFMQRRLQYYPDGAAPQIPKADAEAGLSAIELATSDGLRLGAWYQQGTEPLTYLLLHGNAGHRGDRLPWIRALHASGASVLALDYRGYGGNPGSPSEEGLLLDADAAARWLAVRGHETIVYVGESLGCGVAVGLAARRPPAAFVLVSGFPSLVPVARSAYPWLPVGLLMRDRFECAKLLPSLKVPALFVHGEADTIVPVALGRELYEAAGGPAEWWSIPGAGHNDLPYDDLPAFMARLEAFLEREGVAR
jgi:pimeloyl-ACP methyl ester carboxylesterase